MEPLTFELPWVLVLLPVVVALAIHIGRAGHRLLSPARLRAVRVLRPLSAALLVLALAGAAFERREDRLTVIFAVDGSRSVGGAGNPQTERWLTEAVQQIPENDRAGVVVFGREAMIDTVPTDQIRSGEVLARPADDGTDIEAAIRLARGLFPPQQEARLVLLSDGVETRGSVEQIAAVLPPELDLVWTPIAPPRASEVMVEQISVPEKVVEGEPHRVRVVARSSTATTATLRLFRGSVPVAAIPVELPAGQSRVFAFDQVAPLGSGVLLYRARIEAATDTTPENNRGQALVEVAGRPSVLIVDREPGAITPLADALRQAGMRVRSGRPGLLPADVHGLAAYGAVVLSDVGAQQFSAEQIAALSTWVEDLGGGLLMLGGPQGFGRGGWWNTPVEQVLPLDMAVKDRSYFPSVGLVLCLDKSGSMAGSAGTQKIELAKAAAAGVVDLLQPTDRIAVIAFDAAAKWIVPMTPVGERTDILTQLGTLRAGGGTDAYPAMTQALESLQTVEARVKHVILFTDGQLVARDHEGLAAQMQDAGITVSTVGVGTDADLFTLDRIARAGGGTFYPAYDIQSVPQIFLRDAFRVARSWLVEETFQPVRVGSHPAISGLTATPSLDGYVAASEKAGAEHLLATHRGDPLLSLWRVGLGKSVAFTSDAKARWASRWLRWPGYGATWAALVRWAIRDPAAGRLRVGAETRGGQLHLAADLLDTGGAFVNGARLAARVVGPDGEALEVELEQEGPGRYTAAVEATQEGPYLAAVVRQSDGPPGEAAANPREGATVAAIVPYADEYRGRSRAPEALERLVAAGRVRQFSEGENLFQHLGTGGRVRWPLTPLLLSVVAFLLALEVAVRKLALPSWLERRSAVEPQPAEERFSALQAARRRATRREPVAEELTVETDSSGPEARESGPVVEPSPTEQAPPALKPQPDRASGGSDSKTGSDIEPDVGYTSRLLAAKRRSKSGQ